MGGGTPLIEATRRPASFMWPSVVLGDFELLMTFGAVEVESECGIDDEPYECTRCRVLVLGSRAGPGAYGASRAPGACRGAWCVDARCTDRAYGTKELREAEREPDAARRRTALNIAVRDGVENAVGRRGGSPPATR